MLKKPVVILYYMLFGVFKNFIKRIPFARFASDPASLKNQKIRGVRTFRRGLLLASSALVIPSVIFYILNPLFPEHEYVPVAKAGVEHNIRGTAWSDNIGWEILNSVLCDTNSDGINDSATAGCPPIGSVAPDHGVNINFTTGIITGFAWSDSIGWIDFNPTIGFPAAPFNAARMDTATGNISGWVRAPAATAGSAGGWDGWIKMGGTTSVLPEGWPNSVKLDLATGVLTGFAWGDLVVGWLEFSSTINRPPVAVDDTAFTHEFIPFVDIAVLANDFDPDADPLTIVSVTSLITNGTASIIGAPGSQLIRYTRNPLFVGVDTFTYTITDGHGNFATANVTVTVFDCGDGVKQLPWEECDLNDFGTEICKLEIHCLSAVLSLAEIK